MCKLIIIQKKEIKTTIFSLPIKLAKILVLIVTNMSEGGQKWSMSWYTL